MRRKLGQGGSSYTLLDSFIYEKKKSQNFYLHSLCVRHSVKCILCIIPFNTENSSIMYITIPVVQMMKLKQEGYN